MQQRNRTPAIREATPHSRAKLRMGDAAAQFRVVTELVQWMQARADAEFEAASAELRMYSNPDGSPLPEYEQHAIRAKLKMPAIGQ